MHCAIAYFVNCIVYSEKGSYNVYFGVHLTLQYCFIMSLILNKYIKNTNSLNLSAASTFYIE